MILTYILAGIGAITVIRWIFIGARQFWKDWHSKPTPWLGLPWGPG